MLGHKHLLPSINISLAEILKLAEEYIVYFFIKVAVISVRVLLTACDPKTDFIKFRQNDKQQICGIAPCMNITGAYIQGSELVFEGAATGASVSCLAVMVGGKGCSPFCSCRNATALITSLH